MIPLPLMFQDRAEPLPPTGVYAAGAPARRLAERLCAEAPDVQVLGVGEGLVVLGPAERLPWGDGVTWLAREPAASSLVLSTRRALAAPAGLVVDAIRRAVPGAGPYLVLEQPLALASLDAVHPLDTDALRAWLDA